MKLTNDEYMRGVDAYDFLRWLDRNTPTLLGVKALPYGKEERNRAVTGWLAYRRRKMRREVMAEISQPVRAK